eukprot:Em0029g28a
MASPAPPLPGTGADGGGRASGTSGESDGTDCEGYSFVSEYWGNGLSMYSEPRHVKKLRSWAVSECLDHIRADDQFTDCISVGPYEEQ